MPEFLTPEGRSKIENELTVPKDKKPEIAKRIRASTEMGDLTENTEYITAKDEQAWVEYEIARLQNLLKSAETIDSSKSSDRIGIGSKVRLKNNSGIMTYTIVGSEESDPSNGRISHRSPLGQALLEKSVNDKVNVDTPNGLVDFKIISIE